MIPKHDKDGRPLRWDEKTKQYVVTTTRLASSATPQSRLETAKSALQQPKPPKPPKKPKRGFRKG